MLFMAFKLLPDFLLLIISEHLFAYLVNLIFTNKIYYRFGELNECGIGNDNLIFPIIAARRDQLWIRETSDSEPSDEVSKTYRRGQNWAAMLGPT